MPGKTRKQRAFAGMSKTPEGRAKLRASGKKPMPRDVADEFARKPKKRKR